MLKTATRYGGLILDTAEKALAVFAIYLTLSSMRDLWSLELQQRYRQRTRLAIFAFYIFHLSLLILATGLFGEYLLSTSLASLLVNFTSLANDLFDYTQEFYFNYKRKKQLKALKDKLSVLHISYEQNSFLLNDLIELKDNLELLQFQQNELVILLSQLDNGDIIENARSLEQLNYITSIIKSRCSAIASEEAVIRAYYATNGSSQNVTATIDQINNQIASIQNYRHEIQNAIDAGNVLAIHEIPGYRSKLQLIDKKLKNYNVLAHHFYKILKAKNTVVEIDKQISSLDEKYAAVPFIYSSKDENDQIKKLERDYLLERKASLNEFIQNPIPKFHTRNQTRFDMQYVASESLQRLDKNQSANTLRSVLTTQITTLNNIIEESDKELKQKQKVLEAMTTDPKMDITYDFDRIYKISNQINTIDKAIKLSNVEEKYKLWSSYITILSTTLALFTSYFSYRVDSFISDGLSKLLSILGGVSSLYARRETFKAEAEQQFEKEREANDINDDLQNKAKIIIDASLRAACLERLKVASENLDEDVLEDVSNLSEFNAYLPSEAMQHQDRRKIRSSQTKSTHLRKRPAEQTRKRASV